MENRFLANSAVSVYAPKRTLYSNQSCKQKFYSLLSLCQHRIDFPQKNNGHLDKVANDFLFLVLSYDEVSFLKNMILSIILITRCRYFIKELLSVIAPKTDFKKSASINHLNLKFFFNWPKCIIHAITNSSVYSS